MPSFLDPLKNLFEREHPSRVIGIDIGESSIKLVELGRSDEKAVLHNYGEIALGPRAGSSVGQATNLSPEKIAEALRDLVRETGITVRHAVFTIPFKASLLSLVELPDVSSREMQTMVPLEARKYIPVPITDVSLDWWVLPKRKTTSTASLGEPKGVSAPLGKVEVIIAAISKETLGRYEVIKKEAHLTNIPSHMEIEIFSTLRAIVGSDLDPILVVDIGASMTKLMIIEEGVVRGSHITSSGGQDITLALSRSLNISFEQAEEKKCRVGIVGDEEGRDVLAAGELVISNIMNEAARFTENYERRHQIKIKKVLFVGGGARLKGLVGIAEKNFVGALIMVGNPFTRIDTPAFLSAMLREIGPNFAVAIGAALKGLEE